MGTDAARHLLSRAKPRGTVELNELSDEELGHLACHASETVQREACSVLFRRLWSWSVAKARRSGAPNQAVAMDAAAEAWIRAYRHRCRYDKQRSYRTWLGTIVRNETVRIVARTPPPLPPPEVSPAPGLGGPAASDVVVLVKAAFTALRQHNPRWADILAGWIGGLTYGEIGEKLGIPRNSVNPGLRQAREFVAHHLAENGPLNSGCLLVQDPLAQRAALSAGAYAMYEASWGTVFRCSPSAGLFLRRDKPARAEFVCTGFHMTLWLYPPKRFGVVEARHLAPGSTVVFRWRDVCVIER